MQLIKKRKPIEAKCVDCGEVFTAYAKSALRCEKCRKKKAREQSKECMSYMRGINKIQEKKRIPKKNALSLDQVLHIAEIYRRINGKYIHYGEMVNLIESNAEHCVCCGATIPEGRQVCYECEMEAKK